MLFSTRDIFELQAVQIVAEVQETHPTVQVPHSIGLIRYRPVGHTQFPLMIVITVLLHQTQLVADVQLSQPGAQAEQVGGVPNR